MTKRSQSAPTHSAHLHLCCAMLCVLLASCQVKPKPLSVDERATQASQDRKDIFSAQPKTEGSMNLYDAMARAIRYNLDHRLKIMEHALELQQIEVARREMLPELAANAGWTGRNNDMGGTSQSLVTGRESLEASRSQDRSKYISDLTMSWNVLDFGLSYMQAKKRADLALISQERRRKVIQNIIQDVRVAFWRAVSAQEIESYLPILKQRITIALANAEKEEALKLRNPIDSLDYQRNLLQARERLEALEKEVEISKAQLISLINIPPEDMPELDTTLHHKLYLPNVNWSMFQLEEMALLNRPELLEESYQQRISVADTRSALLSLLPGLTMDVGYNYDSNSFAANQSWSDYGLAVGWNLFNILKAPAQHKASKLNEAMTDMRRKALSMAVIAQVHIARRELDHASKAFRSAYQLERVESRIRHHMQSRVSSQQIGELDMILTDVNALAAIIQRNLEYGELQNSLGRLYQSVGLDPLPAQTDSADLSELALEIAAREQHWQRGTTPELFYAISFKPVSPPSEPQDIDPNAAPKTAPAIPIEAPAKPLIIMQPISQVKVTEPKRVQELFSVLGFKSFQSHDSKNSELLQDMQP